MGSRWRHWFEPRFGKAMGRCGEDGVQRSCSLPLVTRRWWLVVIGSCLELTRRRIYALSRFNALTLVLQAQELRCQSFFDTFPKQGLHLGLHVLSSNMSC